MAALLCAVPNVFPFYQGFINNIVRMKNIGALCGHAMLTKMFTIALSDFNTSNMINKFLPVISLAKSVSVVRAFLHCISFWIVFNVTAVLLNWSM